MLNIKINPSKINWNLLEEIIKMMKFDIITKSFIDIGYEELKNKSLLNKTTNPFIIDVKTVINLKGAYEQIENTVDNKHLMKILTDCNFSDNEAKILIYNTEKSLINKLINNIECSANYYLQPKLIDGTIKRLYDMYIVRNPEKQYSCEDNEYYTDLVLFRSPKLNIIILNNIISKYK